MSECSWLHALPFVHVRRSCDAPAGNLADASTSARSGAVMYHLQSRARSAVDRGSSPSPGFNFLLFARSTFNSLRTTLSCLFERAVPLPCLSALLKCASPCAVFLSSFTRLRSNLWRARISRRAWKCSARARLPAPRPASATDTAFASLAAPAPAAAAHACAALPVAACAAPASTAATGTVPADTVPLR